MHVRADTLFVNPAHADWDLGAFHMLAECRSADGALGGDFFAFRLRAPKRLAVVIGDVCGRGHEGAHLLPRVLTQLEQLLPSSAKPSHLLQELNRSLTRQLSSDRFVTGAAIEIDAQAGTITVANAGHVPAVIRRAFGGASIVGRASGPPLGILHDSSYFDQTCRFGAGDVLVLMTDGVVEAVETDLAEMPRLTRIVADESGSGAIHGRVLAQLAAKAGEPDDMTLLSLELMRELNPANETTCRLAI